MPSEMEMRHRERDMLFRVLRAIEFDGFPKLVEELTSGMEEEDVALVRQKIDKLKNNQT